MRQFAIFHYNEYLFKLGATTTDGALDVARDRIKAKIDAFNDNEREKAKGDPKYVYPQPPFKIPNRAEVIEIPGLGGEMLPWQQQLKKQQLDAQNELAAVIAVKEAEVAAERARATPPPAPVVVVAPTPIPAPAPAPVAAPVMEKPPVVEAPQAAVVIGGDEKSEI